MATATMSWDDGKHMKVNSVQISYEDVIRSIAAEYEGDQKPRRHGTPGKKTESVSLSPDEYITDVTGYYKTLGDEDAITALAFKTNKTEYGPYGNKTRNQFSIHAPRDNQVAGFQGIISRSNVFNSIDVHFGPLPSSSSSSATSTPSSAFSQPNRVEAQGGKGGTSFDDGAHDHVRRVYVGQGESGVTFVKFEYEKSGNMLSREHGNKTLLGAEVFEVDPDDYITSVEVHSDKIFGQDTEVITCLIFETSKGKTSPPFGIEGAQKYELKDKNGGKLVGFHGRVGEMLHALGAYFVPSSGTTPSGGSTASTTQPAGSASANKVDAQGGKGGTSFDDGAHDHVRRVHVGQGESGVTYVKFEYEKNGNMVSREHGKKTLLGAEVFEVDPDDYIISVEVHSDKIFGKDTEVITCLIFKTSKGKTSPPFGIEGAEKYELKDKNGGKIVGFHGRVGEMLHALGAYFVLSSSTTSSGGGGGGGTASTTQPAGSADAKKLAAKGGNAGNPWDDGSHDGVKKVYVGQGESGVSYVKFVYSKDANEVPGNEHGKRTLLAPEEFEVDYPNEYITSVEINYDKIFGSEAEVITMLRFKTNKRTSPPFGLESAASVLLEEDGHKIVGFHGKAGADIMHQIGIYVKPVSK